MECNGHTITFFLEDGKVTTTGNLSDLEKEYAGQEFVRIHSKYLVNSRRISLLEKKNVVLEKGITLPLSRYRVKQVEIFMIRRKPFVHCGSFWIPVVDAVVNTRFMEMQESDIEFSCVIQARVPEKLIYEVSIILANLLDNAIEAEQKEQGKRKIRLNITQKGQYLCIRVENRISESVIAQNRFLETTKPDKERHGFGMKSIDFHCKRCGGFHGVLEENGFFIYEVFLKDKAEIQKV